MIKVKSFDLKNFNAEEVETFLQGALLLESFVGGDNLIYTYREKTDIGPNKQLLLNDFGKKLTDATKNLIGQTIALGQHDKEISTFEGSEDGKHKLEEQRKEMVKTIADIQNNIDETVKILEAIYDGTFVVPAPNFK